MLNEVIIGYWRRREDGKREQLCPEDCHLPWPKANELSDKEVKLALAELALLESHPDIEDIGFMGSSTCRLCGCLNGSHEFFLPFEGKVYRWPVGLKHYIAEHNVALPDELKQLFNRFPVTALTTEQTRILLGASEAIPVKSTAEALSLYLERKSKYDNAH